MKYTPKSFFSAGSSFWHNGTFEVKKNEAEANNANENADPSPSRNVLKVIVPSELEGVAYIQVSVKRISGKLI